ncbi:hypothetical protein GQX73_g2653 [Xylaria multiplex]|uniref:C2H2 type master regulator of conidiophore development brlA n=1 Tax=Xylaria multiplex TaxID=323545 RepID=A0A7C8NAU1_9PEZI|nr:hypothetical protein GQX73_g2653 [Xylaria multiplex]
MAIFTRTVIVPRSHGLSPGAVAGAVIGSVLGGSILLIILGFLYFRHRRMSRIAQAEEALHQPSTALWPGLPLGLKKEERPNGIVPLPPLEPIAQRSPTSPYEEDWMRNNQPFAGYDPLPEDISFSLPPRQQTFPITAEQTLTTPLNHASTAPEAANSSYYDTRISMDSDPAQAITPPSMQMSEMYKAQLREAEEHRRSSSIHRRIWNTFTRQSTRNSKGTVGDGAQSLSSQQQFGNPSVDPVAVKQEAGQESLGGVYWQGIAPNYVEEPEQITEGGPNLDFHDQDSGSVGKQQPQYQYRPTQDSQYGGFPGRNDSNTRVLPTTEQDPTLPSSVLTIGSTYGLPPEPQPQSPIEQRERLKSPEIPEPMNVDGPQPGTNGHSPFRSSHSPQLSPPDSYTINPMAILHPTNPAEQAAYTTYQIKYSASPPAMPPPAPEIITQQPTQEDVVDLAPSKGDDFADMYLDLPSDEEHRRSIDSYEYPSTPGQSSIAESNGRTPDTRPTVSPSPFPTVPEHGKLKLDSNFSPNSSKPSPPSGQLACSECGREFDQIHKLNHHKRYHDRSHACTWEGCDRKFGTKTHLDRHINDRHLKIKTYHCTEPTCAWFRGGKSFPRKDNWRRHMSKKHGYAQQDFERMELSME